jgi:hypothetical protein
MSTKKHVNQLLALRRSEGKICRREGRTFGRRTLESGAKNPNDSCCTEPRLAPLRSVAAANSVPGDPFLSSNGSWTAWLARAHAFPIINYSMFRAERIRTLSKTCAPRLLGSQYRPKWREKDGRAISGLEKGTRVQRPATPTARPSLTRNDQRRGTLHPGFPLSLPAVARWLWGRQTRCIRGSRARTLGLPHRQKPHCEAPTGVADPKTTDSSEFYASTQEGGQCWFSRKLQHAAELGYWLRETLDAGELKPCVSPLLRFFAVKRAA